MEGLSAPERARGSIYFELLVTVGLFVFPATLQAVRLAVVGFEGRTHTSFAFLTMAVQELLLIGLVVHVARLHGERLPDFTRSPRWTDIPWAVALLLCAYIVYVVVLFAVWLGSADQDAAVAAATPRNLEGFVQPMSFGYAAFVTVNPFCEEILLRAFLQTRLRQLGWAAPFSVIASAVVQGGYHVYQGWVSAIGIALMMLVLAGFYERTRRLWPAIGAHLIQDVWWMVALTRTATG